MPQKLSMKRSVSFTNPEMPQKDQHESKFKTRIRQVQQIQKSSKSTQNEICIEDESSTEALIFQTGTVMCTYQLDDILLWRSYWIQQCDN